MPAVCKYVARTVYEMSLDRPNRDATVEMQSESSPKLIVFAHHRVMLDAIEEAVSKLPGGSGTAQGDQASSHGSASAAATAGATQHRGMHAFLRDGVHSHDLASDGDSGASTAKRWAHGVDYMRIDGSTPVADRAELVRLFQRDPLCRVAIVSTTAGAVGVDLSAATVVLFAELEWSAGVLLQAEDRAYRMSRAAGGAGSDAGVSVRHAVEVRYLLLRGTVDDTMWRSFRRQARSVVTTVDGAAASRSALQTVPAAKSGTRHSPSPDGRQQVSISPYDIAEDQGRAGKSAAGTPAPAPSLAPAAASGKVHKPAQAQPKSGDDPHHISDLKDVSIPMRDLAFKCHPETGTAHVYVRSVCGAAAHLGCAFEPERALAPAKVDNSASSGASGAASSPADDAGRQLGEGDGSDDGLEMDSDS